MPARKPPHSYGSPSQLPTTACTSAPKATASATYTSAAKATVISQATQNPIGQTRGQTTVRREDTKQRYHLAAIAEARLGGYIDYGGREARWLRKLERDIRGIPTADEPDGAETTDQLPPTQVYIDSQGTLAHHGHQRSQDEAYRGILPQ